MIARAIPMATEEKQETQKHLHPGRHTQAPLGELGITLVCCCHSPSRGRASPRRSGRRWTPPWRSGRTTSAPAPYRVPCAISVRARTSRSPTTPAIDGAELGSTAAPAEVTLHRVAGGAYASTDRVAATDDARFEVRSAAAGKEEVTAEGVFSAWPWRGGRRRGTRPSPHAHLLAHLAITNGVGGDLTPVHVHVCIHV